MVDFAIDVFPLFWWYPHALREKRTSIVSQLKQLQASAEAIVKMFEDPDTTRQMQ